MTMAEGLQAPGGGLGEAPGLTISVGGWLRRGLNAAGESLSMATPDSLVWILG